MRRRQRQGNLGSIASIATLPAKGTARGGEGKRRKGGCCVSKREKKGTRTLWPGRRYSDATNSSVLGFFTEEEEPDSRPGWSVVFFFPSTAASSSDWGARFLSPGQRKSIHIYPRMVRPLRQASGGICNKVACLANRTAQWDWVPVSKGSETCKHLPGASCLGFSRAPLHTGERSRSLAKLLSAPAASSRDAHIRVDLLDWDCGIAAGGASLVIVG